MGEECAKETGTPPQCISAFKGHVKGMMSYRPPPRCIHTLVNALPLIQPEKDIAILKAKCLDDYVSVSKCAEKLGILKECKPTFELIDDMVDSVEPVCKDWVVNFFELDLKAKLRAFQCFLE